MNVAGFEEALTSSVLIEVETDLTVHVASVAGLTLLKLAAWVDRGRESNKDAADLYRLLTSYADAGNADRLYDAELDLLEAAEFDMQLAGAELLGRDVATICEARILSQVQTVLAVDSNRERLVLVGSNVHIRGGDALRGTNSEWILQGTSKRSRFVGDRVNPIGTFRSLHLPR